jgi:type I restriction enzyme S subunit
VNFNFPGFTGEIIDSELGKIPKGWRTGKLKELGGEITDYVANGSFASLKENVTLYDSLNFALFLRNTDLKSNFMQKVYVDEHSYNFLKKTQMHGGEIIISNVGDVGSVYLCPFLPTPMVLGNNTISLKSEYQAYFYSLFTNRMGQFLINSITGGSAQPKFNKTDFRNMKMIIPKENVLNRFEAVAWSLYRKMLKNNAHIQSISDLRDALLPKLMKGEVRVKGFDY